MSRAFYDDTEFDNEEEPRTEGHLDDDAPPEPDPQDADDNPLWDLDDEWADEDEDTKHDRRGRDFDR